jgi:hypothetical protein
MQRLPLSVAVTDHTLPPAMTYVTCHKTAPLTHTNDSAAIPYDATYGMMQYALQSMPSIAQATMIVPAASNYGTKICGATEVITDIQVVS